MPRTVGEEGVLFHAAMQCAQWTTGQVRSNGCREREGVGGTFKPLRPALVSSDAGPVRSFETYLLKQEQSTQFANSIFLWRFTERH